MAPVRVEQGVPIMLEVFYGLHDRVSDPIRGVGDPGLVGLVGRANPKDVFIPGLDGQLCIAINDQVATCMLRRFKYIAIYQSGHVHGHIPALSVSVWLRGSMLGDFIYKSKPAVFTYTNKDVAVDMAIPTNSELFVSARGSYAMDAIGEKEIFFITI